MCGIVGVVGGDEQVVWPRRSLIVEQMLTSITHRGPDDSRWRELAGATFGTARLALVDRPTSAQPMTDPSGRYLLSFNGEIFNYNDLRRQLELAGTTFYTTGDTEVLLHCLIQRGSDALHQLRGQFALAFWDSLTRRLLLARDRTGIVPLYWMSATPERIAFASEVKALRAAGLETSLSIIDAVDAGVLWGLHAGRSVFHQVQSVPPGGFVINDEHGARTDRYWQFEFQRDRDTGSIGEQSEELARLLEVAVRRRIPMYGDPAALVSGGLDSTAVVAILRRLLPDSAIETYSIQFANAALNESPYQAVVAEYFRTNHTSIICDDTTVAEQFVRTVEHTEVPLVRTAPAASMGLAARIEAAGTRTVLSGEGADEFFCGYDLFKVASIRDAWSREPESNLWPEMLKIVMSQQTAQGRAVERAFFEHGLDQRADPLFSHLNRWAASFKITRYLVPEIRAQISLDAIYDGVRRGLPAEYHEWSAVEQAQYLEVTYFLATTLLGSQCDRPYMSHSIEARYPFLDEDVIDFALSLPENAKLDGTNEKAVLKLAVGADIPTVIKERTKQPYTAPEGDVFRSRAGQHLVDQYMSEHAVSKHGVFDRRRVSWLREKLGKSTTSFHDDLAIQWIISTQILADRFGVADCRAR